MMTSTMRHVSAFHNLLVTNCHHALAPSYGNTWYGTSTVSYLSPTSSGGSWPCYRMNCRMSGRKRESPRGQWKVKRSTGQLQ